jgi:hypothetical protein
MALCLVWAMLLGLLSPGLGSFAYAASEGDTNQSVTASVNESVYKEVMVKPSADAYTLNSRADTNYGTWDVLVLKRDNSSNTTRKIFTRFALADLGIRDPEKVVSVTLQVYRTDTSGTTGGVGVYPVNDNTWQESGITWNNAPANAADPLTVVTVGPATKFYEFDVTDYVKSHWQDEALSFAFLGQVHNQQITFASKEQNAAGVGREPRLVLRTTQTPLTSIEVVTPPLKSVYYSGDKLDLTGLVVNGHYEDGSVAPLTAYSVSGFDSSAPAAAQPITVTVEDQTTVFYVEVRPPSGVNPPIMAGRQQSDGNRHIQDEDHSGLASGVG